MASLSSFWSALADELYVDSESTDVGGSGGVAGRLASAGGATWLDQRIGRAERHVGFVAGSACP